MTDSAQRSAVVKMLLDGLGLGHMWTMAGPTDKAVAVLEAIKAGNAPDVWSAGQVLMFRVAFDLWNGSGGASFADVLTELKPEWVTELGTIMLSLGQGDPEHWLTEHGPYWLEEADRS